MAYVLVVDSVQYPEPGPEPKVIKKLTQVLGQGNIFVTRLNLYEAEFELVGTIKPDIVVLIGFQKTNAAYRFISTCWTRDIEVVVEVGDDSDSCFKKVKGFELITEPLEPKTG